MFKLPSLSQAKARVANRKRGISIENVMLGLIVVLIFAGLLYGAFTVVQRYVAKNTALRVIPMASSEARVLFRNQADFVNLDTDLLIQSGAVPIDSIQGTEFVLPFGGTVEFAGGGAGVQQFTMEASWPSDTANAIALCTALLGGQDEAALPTTPLSGPLGEEYTYTDADCTGATPTVTVTYERQ